MLILNPKGSRTGSSGRLLENECDANLSPLKPEVLEVHLPQEARTVRIQLLSSSITLATDISSTSEHAQLKPAERMSWRGQNVFPFKIGPRGKCLMVYVPLLVKSNEME